MTNHEIVKKLVGSIKPVGETNEDENRYENLKAMTALISELVHDVDSVAYDYKNR